MASTKPAVSASQISEDALKSAIRGVQTNTLSSHGRVVVLKSGVQVDDTYYNPQNLYLLGATVSCDRLAESRRSGNASFEVFGSDGFDYVDPIQDYEFVMMTGIETTDQIVWIPLAHLFVVSLEHSQGTGRNTVQCTLVDGSTRFREVPWKKTFAISTQPTYSDAIKLIIADRATWTTYAVGSLGSATVPKGLTYSPDSDPWGEMWKLAQSAGGEVYHDRDGVIQMSLVANPTQVAPSLEIFSSQYSVVDTELTRKVERSDIYNGVICRGSASWLLFPISGEVWDDDPLSPTYRLGPFGERPKIIEDPIATSDSQCVTMATAEFNRVAGIRHTVTFSAIKDPTVEVGSVIRILQGNYIPGLYILDTTQTDIVSSDMSASIRRVR